MRRLIIPGLIAIGMALLPACSTTMGDRKPNMGGSMTNAPPQAISAAPDYVLPFYPVYAYPSPPV